MYLSRTRGRSKKGYKCRKPVSNHQGKHLTVTLAVSQDLGVAKMTPQIGGVKKDDFQQFFKQLAEKLETEFQRKEAELSPEPPKKYMVFLYNCPAHNRAEDLFYKAGIKRELRFLGQVEPYQRNDETLAACRTRISIESATKAVDVVTHSSVGRCAERVFRDGIPRALAMENM